jgi:hypothetical protein
MQNKPPLIGQIYLSRTDPALIVYVVGVNVIEAGETTQSGFLVEACDPAYKDDSDNAYGLDFDAETWEKHDFILQAE